VKGKYKLLFVIASALALTLPSPASTDGIDSEEVLQKI
jgi:hypothetical protein